MHLQHMQHPHLQIHLHLDLHLHLHMQVSLQLPATATSTLHTDTINYIRGQVGAVHGWSLPSKDSWDYGNSHQDLYKQQQAGGQEFDNLPGSRRGITSRCPLAGQPKI